MPVKDLVSRFQEQQKQFTENLRQQLQAEIADIFANHPQLESFSWTQYTPYFNDGDTCTFGVNLDYRVGVKFAGIDIEDIDAWEWQHDPANLKRENTLPIIDQTALTQAVEAMTTTLGSVPEDIMKTLYGDHVRVILTRDGFTTDYYDHD